MKRKIISTILSVCMILTTFVGLGKVNVSADRVSDGQLEKDSGLIAYYPLSRDVKDYSENGHDAEIVGPGVSFKDGALTLPGGKSSSTNYVKLPGNLFVNRDTLTISVWLKSNTNKGNYSALFFGTQANSHNMPENYWLFNPSDPKGNFKSVFTDSVSPDKPYNTEVGVNGPSTVSNKGVWTHYTTVISPDSVTGYINGKCVGTHSKNRKTSDFGDTLDAYIGRSNYLSDALFGGAFQDLRVYDRALDESEVRQVYEDAQSDTITDILLDQAAKALSIGNTDNIFESIKLPKTGINGTSISWDSDCPEAISDSGKVTMADKAQTATLTATLKLLDRTVTKDFQVSVVKKSDEIKVISGRLRIPYILTQNDTLPCSLGPATVTWKSGLEKVIHNDGTITAPETGMAKVHLTATINYNGMEATRKFDVKVMENNPDYILGYTCNPGDIELTDSLHLGFSEDGETYKALHNNAGILFAKADLTDGVAGKTKLLMNPCIFRMTDNSFGVVATRINTDGKIDPEAKSSVLFYTSKDLLTYHEAGLINLHTDKAVNHPVCGYDSSAKIYRIGWTDDSGTSYYNTTEDFKTVSQPLPGVSPTLKEITTDIPGATPGYAVPVTKSEGKKIIGKLQTVVNTGISVPVQNISKGTKIDFSKVKAIATYSDGSASVESVDWSTEDIVKVNVNKVGTYTVHGTVRQTSYPFPMIKDRADPDVFKYQGKYYFIATDENGQKDLKIRVANSILGLKDAPDKTIFKAHPSGEMSGCIWAPELHVIRDNLYIFFAAGKPRWNTVQSYVMQLKYGGDPTAECDWEKPQRVQKKDGSYLYNDGITLDMTCFENGGKYYAVWAQRYIGKKGTGTSDLWIATVNADTPWKLTSDPVKICVPDYGWDRNETEVDEGPNAIFHKGKIFITFSGAATKEVYCIGMLTASVGADLLKKESWVKSNYPILTSDSVKGQYGPGHNSFTIDEDGNDVVVFHAKGSSHGSRDMTVRRVHWAADGTPVLDMTDGRELLPGNKNVTATVNVIAGALNKITIIAPKHGTITADKTAVRSGGSVTFYVYPNSGYKLKTFTVNGNAVNIPRNGCYTVTNVTENITAAAAFASSPGGTSHHSGNKTPAQPPKNEETPPAQKKWNAHFRSDTTDDYHFTSGGSYVFKITTPDTIVPSCVSSDPAAVRAVYAGKTAGGYLFRIVNVGEGKAEITTTAGDGTKITFTAYGSRLAGLTSDTPYHFKMHASAVYQFKFVSAGGKPVFTSGNSGMIMLLAVIRKGNVYYVKVKASGADSAGLYAALQGQSPTRQCVIQVK